MNTQEKVKNVLAETINQAESFPWHQAEKYAMWLAQTMYFVKYSTRLFALSSAHCPVEDNKFHQRFLKHLQDELGHENLAISDIKQLGFEVKDLPELPQTKALYQTQYYWIQHVSSYSFFGYLLALEGLAVYIGPKVFQAVTESYGSKASKFLKVHTEEDIDHLGEVYQWIDKMGSKDREMVFQNLELSANIYSHMLQSIKSEFLADKERLQLAA